LQQSGSDSLKQPASPSPAETKQTTETAPRPSTPPPVDNSNPSSPKSAFLIKKPSKGALRNTADFSRTKSAQMQAPVVATSEDDSSSSVSTDDSSSDDDDGDNMPVNEETISLGSTDSGNADARATRDRFTMTKSQSSPLEKEKKEESNRSKRKFRRAKKRTFDSGDSSKQRRNTNLLGDDENLRNSARMLPDSLPITR